MDIRKLNLHETQHNLILQKVFVIVSTKFDVVIRKLGSVTHIYTKEYTS